MRDTRVHEGGLVVASDTALGAADGTVYTGTEVRSGATLQVQGGARVGAKALKLSGTGSGGRGTLRSARSSNSWAGNLTLATNASVDVGPGQLTLEGWSRGAC
jgi:hypothetical protein